MARQSFISNLGGYALKKLKLLVNDNTHEYDTTQPVEVNIDTSAQVQSDWNQTNSQAPDYIKNKPTIPPAPVPLDSSIAPEYTKKPYQANSFVMHDGVLYTNENAIETAEDWNPEHWARTTVAEMMTKIGAPDDAFYVNRGSAWVKAYELQQIAIEGFPVDSEDYEKIGDFNGHLYPYFKIEVTGEVEVGMFNYDTKQYDAEFELSDETHYAQIDAGGNYEIHAKGSGIVSVTVSADSLEGET